jgi:hypothetical protein
MSSAPAVSLVSARSPEKRLHERYPISLNAQYRLLRRGRRIAGAGPGRVINIASGGVLFQTEDELPLGTSIELLISWPVRLEGICPLKLVMRGRTVRTDDRGVAIKTNHYEFRTAGVRASRSNPQDLKRSLRG